MRSSLHIGVLALQGDFERHLRQLHLLNVSGREVRCREELSGLDGLIIPGGESTAMNELIDRFAMRDALGDFIRTRVVWGTCAGSILLAREVDDRRIRPFGAMDISVIRNGYGRQIHSFYAEITARLNGDTRLLRASFIRAPIIARYGNGVMVLAEYGGRPVLLEQPNCMVSTFHTELHDNPLLTTYFLDKIISRGRPKSASSAYRSVS
ncbi:MAG: pyridoxal 5'-phosphate synthase glutaminase subunit PdxT [Candidatus Zixiibacteriota bacterium]|nr:MAG: pyridoxal 5'-phosphate synthase glutaminase subunit PdxT [candidate division Zixibacteria bacterium]